MSKQTAKVKRILGDLLKPERLLVVYAVFDVVCTFIRVQRLTAAMVDAEISSIRTPLAMMSDPLLLLIAAVGLLLGRLWSYLVTIIAGIWLLYHAAYKWQLIASATETPVWSWSVFKYWWIHSEGEWDFPRVVLIALILICAAVLAFRFFRNSRHQDLLEQAQRR
jgi:hypothetical protein